MDGSGSTFSLSKLGLGKSGAVENFLTGATETAGPLNFFFNKTLFRISGLFVVDPVSLNPQFRRPSVNNPDPDPNLDKRSLKCNKTSTTTFSEHYLCLHTNCVRTL